MLPPEAREISIAQRFFFQSSTLNFRQTGQKTTNMSATLPYRKYKLSATQIGAKAFQLPVKDAADGNLIKFECTEIY